MKSELMSAIDLLNFMFKLGMLSESDHWDIVQSEYIMQPLYTIGRYQPVEIQEDRLESMIEHYVYIYKRVKPEYSPSYRGY